MVTAAAFSVLSGVSAAMALWWSDAPVAALLGAAFALIALATGLLIRQLLLLGKELRALEERLRRMAEKSRAKQDPKP